MRRNSVELLRVSGFDQDVFLMRGSPVAGSSRAFFDTGHIDGPNGVDKCVECLRGNLFPHAINDNDSLFHFDAPIENGFGIQL